MANLRFLANLRFPILTNTYKAQNVGFFLLAVTTLSVSKTTDLKKAQAELDFGHVVLILYQGHIFPCLESYATSKQACLLLCLR